uniref:Uncharacterized protein n=1 Tax=Onchocerca volvulus TaxID=6282 RepID=A0A8R1XPW0_ONCVO
MAQRYRFRKNQRIQQKRKNPTELIAKSSQYYHNDTISSDCLFDFRKVLLLCYISLTSENPQ